MADAVAFIGFGEAGQAFAWPGARVFDIKTADFATREAKLADYRAIGVEGCEDAPLALTGAAAVFVLVTADQALRAARDGADRIFAGTLWLDMNSVAPATKRSAAGAIEAGGGRYVDVAVMSPVLPGRLTTPLLVAGPHADAAMCLLRDYGFNSVTVAGPRIGDASAIKMIRSVIVKGMEALSAECALAAHRAGVSEEVFASLDTSWKAQGWAERIDYDLDRMLAHGRRRAAEMQEVARTLEDLGIAPVMTRGTIARQREIGELGVAPPATLAAKLAAIEAASEDLMRTDQAA